MIIRCYSCCYCLIVYDKIFSWCICMLGSGLWWSISRIYRVYDGISRGDQTSSSSSFIHSFFPFSIQIIMPEEAVTGHKKGAYREADQHEKAYQLQKGVFVFGKPGQRKESSKRSKHVSPWSFWHVCFSFPNLIYVSFFWSAIDRV